MELAMDFESFRRTLWREGDPDSALPAWNFYHRALCAALRAELRPLGVEADDLLADFSVDEGSDRSAIVARVLEIVARPLPDDVLLNLPPLLEGPEARPYFDALVRAVRATNSKPLTQSVLAYVLTRNAKPPQVPVLCELACDTELGAAARFGIVMSLKRRRRGNPHVVEVLEQLRADEAIGAEVGRLLDGKWRR